MFTSEDDRVPVVYKRPNLMRRRLIFIEGLDHCGKSTLYRRAEQESGHDVSFHDRGLLGRVAYAKLFKEDYPLEDVLALELALISVDAYAIIFLDPDVRELHRRIEADPEHRSISMEMLCRTRMHYSAEFEYRKVAPYNMRTECLLRIDNTDMSPDDVVQQVLSWTGSTWLGGELAE